MLEEGTPRAARAQPASASAPPRMPETRPAPPHSARRGRGYLSRFHLIQGSAGAGSLAPSSGREVPEVLNDRRRGWGHLRGEAQGGAGCRIGAGPSAELRGSFGPGSWGSVLLSVLGGSARRLASPSARAKDCAWRGCPSRGRGSTRVWAEWCGAQEGCVGLEEPGIPDPPPHRGHLASLGTLPLLPFLCWAPPWAQGFAWLVGGLEPSRLTGLSQASPETE